MPYPITRRLAHFKRLLFPFMLAMLVTIVFVIFVIRSGVNISPRATLYGMIYGYAERPFVYRALLPILVRLLTQVCPPGMYGLLSYLFHLPFLYQFTAYFAHDVVLIPETVFALALMYFSLLGFGFAFHRLTRATLACSERFAHSTTLIAVISLMPFFGYGYIYDFSTLLLSTIALLLLAQARHLLFLLVFAFACVNKETAILLTLTYSVFFFSSRHMMRWRFWANCMLQIAVFICIKAALAFIFRANAGQSVEFNFGAHLAEYERDPGTLLMFSSIVLCLLMPVFIQWHVKPRLLRVSFLIIVPLTGLYVVFGWPYEIRVYYELYPTLVLLLAHTVGRRRLIHDLSTQSPTTTPTGIIYCNSKQGLRDAGLAIGSMALPITSTAEQKSVVGSIDD